MTQFTQKTFSVGDDSRSEVPDNERRQRWNETFASSSCGPCEKLDYAQAPIRNQQCPRCKLVFCPEHLAEHDCAVPLCECDDGCEHLASECPLKRPARSCNRHDDCNAADDKAKAEGRQPPDHCHDDCCEDCFGS